MTPEELIAEHHRAPDHSRLMVLDKATGAIEHRHFTILSTTSPRRTASVLNDSRVLPGPHLPRRPRGVPPAAKQGRRRVEAFGRPWQAGQEGQPLLLWGRPAPLRGGGRPPRWQPAHPLLSTRACSSTFWTKSPRPCRPTSRPAWTRSATKGFPGRRLGSGPHGGAALHPGAGRIQAKGVELGFVTLHVGLGTFQQVSVEGTVQKPRGVRSTTTCPTQTLSTRPTHGAAGSSPWVPPAAAPSSPWPSGRAAFREAGWTDAFLYPGCTFQGVDALITNFHLPESTLIMLVSTLAGRTSSTPTTCGRPGALPLFSALATPCSSTELPSLRFERYL